MRQQICAAALALAACLVPSAPGVPVQPAQAQAQRQDAYGEITRWLFRRYTEGAVAATLARAGAKKPDAQPRLVAAAPRMASTLERHRETFAAVIAPALRASFDAAAATKLAERIGQTPLSLDADMGQRLVAVDQELRRNGQAVLTAILADIDLITEEILDGG